ncbi:hypothetical protein LRP52_37085 [Photobacterium sp. ZSDE20]|uniref:Transcriptional regulator n=1 Tax=Photobacterium pectinilyticum TaxID=2906793 RepID=A0ABT1N782_9GAMM|nr:hypothetical protein [Photobacterium sp. ZSDE20]MCQ1060607.1 hypothetical protein [Photobacterium sp. ZSDE20]MDD1827802.1 hypothetical protein [Photobacterium sp. ZSDE20]
MAQLRDAAKKIEFGEGTLDEWIFFGDKGLKIACSKLKAVEQWSGGGRPHAFVLQLWPNAQFDNNMVHCGHYLYEFQRIVRPGRKTQGPFIALMTVTDTGDNVFKPHTLFIKPVVSAANPIPVDSHYERVVCKYIMQKLDRQHNPRLKWSLTKPLLYKAGGGVALLPDFILQAKSDGKRVYSEIIEVMGTEDQEYAERKARLIPLMKRAYSIDKLTEVFQDDVSALQGLDELLSLAPA